MNKSKNLELVKELKLSGKTTIEIANKLGINRSTVTRIVKRLSLTNPNKTKQYNSQRKTVFAKTKERRIDSHEKGAILAKNNDVYFGLFCGLFWGEGSKNKNSFRITNCDVYLLKYVLKILRSYFYIDNNKICISVQYHDGGLDISEIKKFWLSELSLLDTNWKKPYCKTNKYNTNHKYPYGVCCITISDTELVNNVYGAIKHICDLPFEKWLPDENGKMNL